MEIKWRGGPSSGEGNPWNKKPKVEVTPKDGPDNASAENEGMPEESVEEMAARRLKEMQSRVEGDAAKMEAIRADAQGEYAGLLKKVDAKVENDLKKVEDAKKRLKDF
ncbi:hypothetical protein A2851_00390 [Candidatus Kaiserbacteria bacterium RIFCSPHIGHO2_01_FULL_53_29]|uniref:Uncharacterized protein n=1 Tax=Candidatus Kaiserbacteria bacterium RIFCSPHIGHO2_01_FULL_53_29 TaxID=1798480 RepID=A0A1F6CU65_9BACT|nr:MAG: hypothetical protein A2851_00390 [Candidatus Kaiserbacteria bacterium RIFCSPHIGHO2_01_FULL_53_29]